MVVCCAKPRLGKPSAISLWRNLKPLGMTQTDLAARLGVSYPGINELVQGKQGLTTNIVLKLSRLFGTSPEFWL